MRPVDHPSAAAALGTPAGKARRTRISGIFERGATQPDGMQRRPNAAGVSPRAAGRQIVMFITKKHLSRRTVLKGMGASFALPLLDSMVPARTLLAKTAAAPVSRLACIEMVHGAAGSSADGIVKHYWSPVKEGANFEFTPTLSPLEPFRDYVTIISDPDLH